MQGLNIYQIGDVLIRLSNQKTSPPSYSVDASPRKLAFSDRFVVPQINTAGILSVSVEGFYFDDAMQSADQLFSRLKNLQGHLVDIISYRVLDVFPLTAESIVENEDGLVPSEDNLLWMETSGILGSVSMSDENRGVGSAFNIEFSMLKPWQPLNRITWEYNPYLYSLDKTFDYTNDNPGIANLVSWWPLDEAASGFNTNLVSYWELEEASGTRIDSHGSNDLTDNATVTQADGIQGFAAQFTRANSEYLSITDAAQSGLDLSTACTIIAWIQLDSLPSAAGNFGILSKYNSGANERSYALYVESSANKVIFIVSSDGTGATLVSVTGNTFGGLSVDTWYFIVARYDGTNISLEINGQSQGTAAIGSIHSGTADFYIGQHAGEYHNGRIDEVAIWSRALADWEVAHLYDNGAGTSYDELIDISATNPVTRVDAYGSNNLTDTNSVETTYGLLGNAGHFNRDNTEYLTITNANQTGLDITGEITLCAWIYLDSLPSVVGQLFGITAKWTGSPGNRSYALWLDTSNRAVFVVSNDGTTLNSITATGFGALSLNTWYFICGRYDGSNLRLRVNTTDQTPVSYSSGIFDGTGAFYVGYNNAGVQYFDGRIDEPAVWEVALSDDEVTYIYNQGVPVGIGELKEDIPVSENFIGFQSSYPTWRDIEHAVFNQFVWAKRNLSNGSNEWSALYQTPLWEYFVNNTPINYPRIGEYGTLQHNDFVDVYSDPSFFNAPPISWYSVDIDPFLVGEKLILQMTVSDEDSFSQRIHNAELDMQQLDDDLTARGHSGITAGDILVFGDFPIAPGFIIRGTKILQNVYPRFAFEKDFPGQLGLGRSRVKLSLPDFQYASTLTYLHMFRSY